MLRNDLSLSVYRATEPERTLISVTSVTRPSRPARLPHAHRHHDATGVEDLVIVDDAGGVDVPASVTRRTTCSSSPRPSASNPVKASVCWLGEEHEIAPSETVDRTDTVLQGASNGGFVTTVSTASPPRSPDPLQTYSLGAGRGHPARAPYRHRPARQSLEGLRVIDRPVAPQRPLHVDRLAAYIGDGVQLFLFHIERDARIVERGVPQRQASAAPGLDPRQGGRMSKLEMYASASSGRWRSKTCPNGKALGASVHSSEWPQSESRRSGARWSHHRTQDGSRPRRCPRRRWPSCRMESPARWAAPSPRSRCRHSSAGDPEARSDLPLTLRCRAISSTLAVVRSAAWGGSDPAPVPRPHAAARCRWKTR